MIISVFTNLIKYASYGERYIPIDNHVNIKYIHKDNDAFHFEPKEAKCKMLIKDTDIFVREYYLNNTLTWEHCFALFGYWYSNKCNMDCVTCPLANEGGSSLCNRFSTIYSELLDDLTSVSQKTKVEIIKILVDFSKTRCSKVSCDGCNIKSICTEVRNVVGGV